MRKWVDKNINPVGLEKNQRGSLNAVIASDFGRVRDDSHTAVKAHFPFLANEEKLRKHGKALYIPNIKGDTLEEYRQRVSTASFFLSRAGERSYILEQMEAHFGGRFILKEEFLQVFVKIVDLADDDRRWVLDFLDSLLDPNISLTVAEWYHFVEKAVIADRLFLKTKFAIMDSFKQTNLKLNGRVRLDGHTVKPVEAVRTRLNGGWKLDGGIQLGSLAWIAATEYIRVPIKLRWGILDKLEMEAKTYLLDTSPINGAGLKLNGRVQLDGQTVKPVEAVRTALNGEWKLDGGIRLSGQAWVTATEYVRVPIKLGLGTLDRLTIGKRYRHILNGQYRLDGNKKMNSGIYFPIPA
jgi:hypothetical protein